MVANDITKRLGEGGCLVTLLVRVGGEKDEALLVLTLKSMVSAKKSAGEVINGYFTLSLTNVFQLPRALKTQFIQKIQV